MNYFAVNLPVKLIHADYGSLLKVNNYYLMELLLLNTAGAYKDLEYRLQKPEIYNNND